jgi:predicted alpha/beta-hydrolase family hydrolase
VIEFDTPHGPARVHRHSAAEPWAHLVLGHGAGGSVDAPDLRAATAAALSSSVSVFLVEQPYRVAGRRSPSPAHQLDAAWISVLGQLDLGGLPHLSGGRSSGARVACRTAAATGADGVLCLAFPLLTPNGKSRQAELDAVAVPLLVVQGDRDRFGVPAGSAVVRGDHRLGSDLERTQAIIADWLRGRSTAVGSSIPAATI